MKKIFISIMSFLLVFSLTGCGKEKVNEENNQNNFKEVESPKTTNDVEKVDETANSSSENLSGVNEFKALYSDQNKMVFEYTDNSKIVFYHNGTKITGYELYYNYEDAATANLAKQTIKSEDSEDIKDVRVEGSMIIVTYAESTYKDLTLEDVRTVYSYLKEVTK